MKVAIISDLHENFHNLILALQKMDEEKVQHILCLGDMMNTGLATVLAMQEIPCFMIWGNNDGEKVDIVKTSFRENSKLTVSSNTYDFLQVENKRIFISHYDNLAIPMAKSGEYDAVFYGHNHLKKVEEIDGVHVVNPGELCAQKTGVSSFAIYDTTENTIKIIELEDAVSLKTELVGAYFKKHMDKLAFRSKDAFEHE